MSVGRICVRDVWTATSRESVRESARRMGRQNLGTLVVVDEGNQPIGILSDRDIMMRCIVDGSDPDRTTVSELMSTPVSSAHEQMPIEEALQQMEACSVRRMPVVDDKGQLVGIISLDDIQELIAEECATVGRLLAKSRPKAPEIQV